MTSHAAAAPVMGDAPGPHAFTGTAALARLALRRDRVRLVGWLLGVVGATLASARSVPGLYPTSADLQDRGDFVESPVLKIFTGPGYGTDRYTVGAMVANEYLIYCLVAVALMSIFLVVRHTRAEEESGRAELVRAAVVGSHAAPSAALLVAAGANVVIGAATAVALDIGLAELSVAGSWTFGMSMAATGIVFAAAATVAAQVTEHSRGAIGISTGALILALVLRAVGDIGEGRALSWVSPVGWAQSTRPYVDERWWPMLLSVAAAGLLAVLAHALGRRRDLAAGLIRPRPGAARASGWLARPAGLALRLQRGSLIAWAAGLAALGAAFGSLLGEVEVFLTDNPQLQDVFGADGQPVLEAFLGTVMLLLALLATACALSAALGLHREEAAGHAEPILATATSRRRWATGHLAAALGGGTAVLLCAAAGAGLAAAVERGEISWFVDVLGAGLAHLPALWLTVAVAGLLFGVSPRAAVWAWVVLAHAAVVGLLGDALDLPDPVRALSPFHHVPELPGGTVNAGGPVALAALAVALVATGLTALARRDIATT